jgi:hypothetical protein
MTKDLRWRVIALQAIVTILFAFGAGVAYWAHNFTQDQVRSQLVEQQIVFPATGSPALTALPAADASAMTQYAGQSMTNGYQAHTYAEHFIAVHLKEIGQGKPYDYWSGKAMAEQKTNPKLSAADEATALTLFRGETLRSLLNQAWAFWFIGDIALYAAIGLTVGAVVVFLTFLFEVFVAPQRQTQRPKVLAA